MYMSCCIYDVSAGHEVQLSLKELLCIYVCILACCVYMYVYWPLNELLYTRVNEVQLSLNELRHSYLGLFSCMYKVLFMNTRLFCWSSPSCNSSRDNLIEPPPSPPGRFPFWVDSK